jgi:Ca2+-transporting ATPase
VEFGRAIYNNLFNFVRFQMESLVAFIMSYLLAAFLFVLGGTPFTAFVVLWINFLVQIPVAVALGFDDPAPDLMEHKPRPLKQPILTGAQWVRIAFIGLLMAIGTIYLEMVYESTDELVAIDGSVFFSLSYRPGIGLRSELAVRSIMGIEQPPPADAVGCRF